jgi:hypothetical protein
LRKIHREAAVADVASELLAKQRLNIGFVNKQVYLSAPALLVAAVRRRMTLNSVSKDRTSFTLNSWFSARAP